jgi:eukaryotic-like serine/threonine-protein kinase
MPLSAGTRLGRYEIRSLLGAGGMGEVYLAHDSQLRRPVALKLLPTQFVQDETRLRRFRLEAYAVAALSHPNIAHIYEIGADDGAHFIVMEFVDGETLRPKIHEGKTRLSKLLEYLTQVAEGLAKAHAAGIVHRDLKPDNIMIARDGYAKILDFGLAKLIQTPQAVSGEAATANRTSTGDEVDTALLPQKSLPGMVMGTIGYLSPEQARGENTAVDHRADIFSFGCILYEAATEQLAFRGESSIDTLHKIIYEEPPALSAVNPLAPSELDRIVRRCLAKDPEERFQSIKDVAIELRSVRREMEDQPGQAELPSRALSEAAQPVNRETVTETTRTTATSKSAFRLSWPVLLLSVALIAGLIGAYFLWPRPTRTFTPPQQQLISTFAGSHRSASFSPDGKRITFINHVDGVPQVWIKGLHEGQPTQLTFAEGGAARPRWSPNSSDIAYVRRQEGQSGIWLVSANGGEPRKIIEGGRNPNWSWDGKRFVFEREYDVWTANVDGSDQRRVEGVPTEDLLLEDRNPAFSPDGSLIAFFEKDKGPMGDIWVVPAKGGQARQLTFDSNLGGTPAWTADGKFIVFSSVRGGSRTLWKVPAAGGALEAVLASAGEDTEPEISRDGRQLIYTNTRNNFILTITDPVSGKTTSLTESRLDMVYPSFSPRGDKLLFFQIAGDGDTHVFSINTDGSGLTQMTRTKGDRSVHPRWSADGSAIYFYQLRPSLSYRKLQIGNSESFELVAGWEWSTQNAADVDPEGKRIVYSKLDKGSVAATMIHDIANGSESAFTLALRDAQWSPDGKSIIGAAIPARRRDLAEIVICPVDGADCRKLTRGYHPVWHVGLPIYFFRASSLRDGEELWSISVDGKSEKKIMDLRPMQPIGGFFDVSPAGQIVWVQYQRGKNELWLADAPQ